MERNVAESLPLQIKSRGTKENINTVKWHQKLNTPVIDSFAERVRGTGSTNKSFNVHFLFPFGSSELVD